MHVINHLIIPDRQASTVLSTPRTPGSGKNHWKHDACRASVHYVPLIDAEISGHPIFAKTPHWSSLHKQIPDRDTSERKHTNRPCPCWGTRRPTLQTRELCVIGKTWVVAQLTTAFLLVFPYLPRTVKHVSKRLSAAIGTTRKCFPLQNTLYVKPQNMKVCINQYKTST